MGVGVPTQLEVYRVFLASPSDVPAERRAALDLAAFLNAHLTAKHDRLIHFTVWEHLPPSAGRPQETINQLVDECDVFVGLLHERWGTPTGDWSSGFEEEFERAHQRHLRTGRPTMALYFKTPTALPHPDYPKVRDFKRRVGQRIMYRVVETTEQWREALTHFLHQEVVPDTTQAQQATLLEHAIHGLHDVTPTGVAGEEPGNGYGEQDLPLALRDAFGQLSDREKTILGLHYFEAMTDRQVADILGHSVQWVRQQRSRAIHKLRSIQEADAEGGSS